MKLRVYIWSTKTYSSQNGQRKYLCLGKNLYQRLLTSILDWSYKKFEKRRKNAKIFMPWKKPLSTFTNVNFRLVLQKIRKMAKKRKKLEHFGLENS